MDQTEINNQIKKFNEEIKFYKEKIKEKKEEIEKLNQLKIESNLKGNNSQNLLHFLKSDNLYKHHKERLERIMMIDLPEGSQNIENLLNRYKDNMNELFDTMFNSSELTLYLHWLGLKKSGNKTKLIQELLKYLIFTNPNGKLRWPNYPIKKRDDMF